MRLLYSLSKCCPPYYIAVIHTVLSPSMPRSTTDLNALPMFSCILVLPPTFPCLTAHYPCKRDFAALNTLQHPSFSGPSELRTFSLSMLQITPVSHFNTQSRPLSLQLSCDLQFSSLYLLYCQSSPILHCHSVPTAEHSRRIHCCSAVLLIR
jgi:hypothetical protein